MRKYLQFFIVLCTTVLILTGCKPIEPEYTLGRGNILLIVGNDELYGLIDQDNTIIVPIEYQNIVRLGLYFYAEKDNAITLFDQSGDSVFTVLNATIPEDISKTALHYNDTDLSETSLIPFIRDEFCGLVDMSGSIIIEPTYLTIESFNEEYGLILATRADFDQGYINSNGEEIISFQNVKLDAPQDGMIRVRRSLESNPTRFEYGFYNTTGNLVIDFQYQTAYDFSDGFSVVYIDNDYGLIDKEGNYVIQPEYIHIEIHPKIERIITTTSNELTIYDYELNPIKSFSDNPYLFGFNVGYDISAYQQELEAGLIDKDGEIQFIYDAKMIRFANVEGTHFTLYYADDDTVDIVDTKGNIVMTGEEPVIDYHNEIAITEGSSFTRNLRSKDGEIQLTEMTAIHRVNSPIFSHSIYMVQDDSTSYFLDYNGSKLNDEVYTDTSYLSALGLLPVQQNGKWGIIDMKGFQVIPFDYDYIEQRLFYLPQ